MISLYMSVSVEFIELVYEQISQRLSVLLSSKLKDSSIPFNDNNTIDSRYVCTADDSYLFPLLL